MSAGQERLADVVPLFEGPAVRPPERPVDMAAGAPLRVRPHTSHPCPGGCLKMWLDTERRLLECEVCGCHMEAFDYLLRQGRELDVQEGWIRRLSQERLELLRQIEETKRQLSRLRSEVRREGGTPVERHQVQEAMRREAQGG